MMPKKKDTVRLHIADMPKDLHYKVKMAAYREKITLRAYVINALKEKLQRESK